MKILTEFQRCCLFASAAAAAEEEEISVVPTNGFISSSGSSGYRQWRPGLSVISEKEVLFRNATATSRKKTSINDHSKASTKSKFMMPKPPTSYGHADHNNFHNRRNGSREMMIAGLAPAPFIF